LSQSLTGYAIHNRGGGYDNDLPQQAAIFIVHLNFVGKLVFYRNCLNNFLRLKKLEFLKWKDYIIYANI